MAKHSDRKHDDKNKDNDNKDNKDKKSKYEGIKVPASELYAMEEGSAKLLVEGGNRLVDVAAVRNVKIPVTRELDVAVVDVVITEGPMKGAVASWLYHSTQDITILKTPKHVQAEKQARRRALWDKFVSTVTFGLV